MSPIKSELSLSWEQMVEVFQSCQSLQGHSFWNLFCCPSLASPLGPCSHLWLRFLCLTLDLVAHVSLGTTFLAQSWRRSCRTWSVREGAQPCYAPAFPVTWENTICTVTTTWSPALDHLNSYLSGSQRCLGLLAWIWLSDSCWTEHRSLAFMLWCIRLLERTQFIQGIPEQSFSEKHLPALWVGSLECWVQTNSTD